MCYDPQMQGKTTICVSACPVKALEIIDINDPKNADYDKSIYGFEMKKITNPSIRFHKKKEDIQDLWFNSSQMKIKNMLTIQEIISAPPFIPCRNNGWLGGKGEQHFIY